MKIVIETIPHTEQRYPTVGDWWTDADGTWQIRVSKISRYSVERKEAEFLIALHELVEMAICQYNGVDEDDVTRFDMTWGGKEGLVEPGDDRNAPYYAEHQFASGIERLVASQLGLSWPEYETIVDDLDA